MIPLALPRERRTGVLRSKTLVPGRIHSARTGEMGRGPHGAKGPWGYKRNKNTVLSQRSLEILEPLRHEILR